MSISDELQKLDELRRNGAISADEFEIAKMRVLEIPRDTERDRHLEDIKAQNELFQLDREWELERENYMIPGKYGHKHIPGKISSVLVGLFIVCVGIVWTVMATFITGFAVDNVSRFFPLFGVFVVLFGIGMSIYAFSKAVQYGEAQLRYQRRRSEMKNKTQNI